MRSSWVLLVALVALGSLQACQGGALEAELFQEAEAVWSPARGLGLPSSNETGTSRLLLAHTAIVATVRDSQEPACQALLRFQAFTQRTFAYAAKVPVHLLNKFVSLKFLCARAGDADEDCSTPACRQRKNVLIKDAREQLTAQDIAEAPLVGRVPYDTFPARSEQPHAPFFDVPGASSSTSTRPAGTHPEI